jgi:AAA+ superfamily predicted ATPase
MESDAVIASLLRAVEAMPDDVTLRLHLAAVLADSGQRDEAVRQIGVVLQADPASTEALRILQRTAGPSAGASPQPPAAQPPAARPPAGPPPAGPPPAGPPSAAGPPPSGQGPSAPAGPADVHHPATPAGPADIPDPAGPAGHGADRPGFDWAEAEADVRGVAPPMFVTETGAAADPGTAQPAYDAERPGLRLADVAGLTAVKQRLEAAFLAPMRNPELRRLYAKSLRGGLLLYGPPGCGKTFIARAVAGELGARFMAVSFADVIDMYVGSSERNIHEMFAIARRNAPCVLFLDEVDAIGQKRSQLRSTPMRTAVNQLLLELDDISGGNEGVFVLAATNHPWDVDSALRRPGRFDRTLLVLPPDAAAREAVFRYHLAGRPVAGIELGALAAITDGYSGADIAHVCETASELALLDSASSGEIRMIGQQDLLAAAAQVRPSVGPWLDAARNVALFANEGGAYDDLVGYLRKRKLL